MLRRNIISIQPVLHLMLPEIYKIAQCSSFKQDYTGQWRRNPFGGMSLLGTGSTFWLTRKVLLQGIFRPMSNEHVTTWTSSVYTVHVTIFPRGRGILIYMSVVSFCILNEECV